MVPVSKGGELSWSNCVTACRSCNAKKGNKTLRQLGWTTKQIPRVRSEFSCCTHPLILTPLLPACQHSADTTLPETYVACTSLIMCSALRSCAVWSYAWCDPGADLQEPKPHELAPLRLVPKVAMEVQSAEAHPWEVYVSPFLQSYSSAHAAAALQR